MAYNEQTLNIILSRLDGVKQTGQTGQNQYQARCPCHADKKASLSVSIGKDEQILLYCHAECSTEKIVSALGLKMSDLFPKKNSSTKRRVVASYSYSNGAQKIRYDNKDFTWRQPDGRGGWQYNRKGLPHVLYVAGALASPVFVVEGEKDADNIHRLGFNAVCTEDGAKQNGKGWHAEYTEQLSGVNSVYVIPDHDAIGHEFAQTEAAALYGHVGAVYMLDLATVWTDIKEKQDISDYLAAYGAEQTKATLQTLMDSATAWTPETSSTYTFSQTQPEDTATVTSDPFLSCFKTLDDFSEEEATWLIPGWIPDGQITLMAADGGVGKTTLWVNLIAAISSGNNCILDPPEYEREPQKVAFLTTEDSVRKKLHKKLRLAGANMANIITPDFLDDKNGALRGFKFGSPEMGRFVRHFRPALCVFDPVQGFVPPDINMGSRNAMRDCMAPLISLGEECGTTFLVICHTNKRKGAFGRDRIADSADLWDISRSVLMAGYAEEQGVRYLSNEKNNYAELQKTILFTIDADGQPHFDSSTYKRDREFTQAAAVNNSAPKRIECAEWIINELIKAGGTLPTKTLESNAKDAGYSFSTIRRAKDELKIANKIKYVQSGYGTEKSWNIQLIGRVEPIESDDPDELPF